MTCVACSALILLVKLKWRVPVIAFFVSQALLFLATATRRLIVSSWRTCLRAVAGGLFHEAQAIVPQLFVPPGIQAHSSALHVVGVEECVDHLIDLSSCQHR